MLSAMKKLSIIIAATASLALAAPVFACPGHDDADAAPKTAEKAKEQPKGTKATDAKPKQEQPKQDTGTTTAKKKDAPKQDTTKKPDKVSQK
jgi:hypothetical protein